MPDFVPQQPELYAVSVSLTSALSWVQPMGGGGGGWGEIWEWGSVVPMWCLSDTLLSQEQQ